MDTQVAVDWVKKTLKPHTEHLKRIVLLADNLSGQVHEDFKENVSDCSGVVWYGLPNATDLWQPADAGYGKMLKTLMKQEHHRRFDGEEYKKLRGDEYNEFRKTLWLKTGCLITADGLNDDKIAPEGLPNYQVPPPSQYLESAVQPPESNGVEFEKPPPPDTIVANDDNFLSDGQ